MAEKINPKNTKQNKQNIKPQKKNSWNKVWAVVGLALLFGCGVVVGLCYNLNHSAPMKPEQKQVHLSQTDCDRIAGRILFMQGDLQIGKLDDKFKQMETDNDVLRQLKQTYQKQCDGHQIDMVQIKQKRDMQKRPVPQPMVKVEPAQREPMPQETCAAVEKILKKQLSYYWDEMSVKPDYHLTRAQIFANLATRGCPENSENYKNMALREIEIARALNDDSFNEPEEIVDLIDTYRKLNMKQEAQQAIEKIKRITDPAIDFILQVEKIINE